MQMQPSRWGRISSLVRLELLLTTIFLVLVIATASAGITYVEQRIRTNTGQALQTVLETTNQAYNIWWEQRAIAIQNLASNPETIRLAKNFLGMKRDTILDSPDLTILRRYFDSYLRQSGDVGMFFIAPDNVNVASMHDENIARLNLIASYHPELLARVWQGETVFIPPVFSDIQLLDPITNEYTFHVPTLFAATPIYDPDERDIIAVLTLRINIQEFTRIAFVGGVGQTGETYAINHNARLISESRFDHELRITNRIAQSERGLYSILVTDPGGDLLGGYQPTIAPGSYPLTVMAESVTHGLSGMNLSGYRNYRGVRVLGTWLWNDTLNFGVASEIEEAEVLRSLVITRITILFITALTSLLAIMLNIILFWTRRQAFIRLQEANQQLEQRVVERTLELVRARDAADLANDAKTTFLANMSHELRTPLNAILGFAQIMQSDPDLPKKYTKHLDTILSSGKHLLGLINSVLDLAKIESGHSELQITSVDLYQLLQDLEKLFVLETRAKGIGFQVTYSPNVPRIIEADSVKLYEVLINLVDNAIKFTDEGLVSIDVHSPVFRADQLELTFTIKDTGTGINDAELDKLFQPFEQTMSGRASRTGSGLGLAISLHNVQLMGGSIDVSSKVGEGTTFHITILARPASSEDALPGLAAKKIIELASESDRRRILIVDDVEVAHKLLAGFLEPLRFELRHAHNGSEAVAIAATWQPHCIFMDMKMPVMDGYEATRHIKAQNSHQPITIIAMTATHLEADIQRAFDAGCDDFLGKPFFATTLFAMLHTHLGVRFLYEGDSAAHPATDSGQATAASIPPELLNALMEATLRVEIKQIDALISEVQEFDVGLGQKMRDVAKGYKYDQLIILLEEMAQNKPQ